MYAAVRAQDGFYLGNALQLGHSPHQATAYFTSAPEEAALALRVTVHNEPVNVTDQEPNALQVSLTRFQSVSGPDSFGGSISALTSLGATLRNTVVPAKLNLHVVSPGLISYTFLVDIDGVHYVLVPAQKFRVGSLQNSPSDLSAGCGSVIDDAVSCFKAPGADQDLCTSQAQTDNVRRCCNLAAEHRLYVECLT